MKKTFFALLAIAALSSCTDNERVKNFGGSAIMEIPFNQKFVNVTWKESELWVLTKQRTNEDTTYNTYHFSEKSSWGVMEGTYTITEKRP
jgi:starvation-inducible outer membrane lipoprotein